MVSSKTVDEKILQILNDSEQNMLYLKSLNFTEGRRNKIYQTVIVTELEVGFILKNQTDIIAIYGNTNPLLGNVIMESKIFPTPVAGKRVNKYYVIDIHIPNIVKGVPHHHRNLGKILLMASGIRLKDNEEAHHKYHAMINTLDSVFAVTKSEHAGKRQLLTNAEAIEYIKTKVLKMNNIEFEKLNYNLRLITERFKKHGGMQVTGINFSKDYLCDGIFNSDNVKLSVY